MKQAAIVPVNGLPGVRADIVVSGARGRVDRYPLLRDRRKRRRLRVSGDIVRGGGAGTNVSPIRCLPRSFPNDGRFFRSVGVSGIDDADRTASRVTPVERPLRVPKSDPVVISVVCMCERTGLRRLSSYPESGARRLSRRVPRRFALQVRQHAGKGHGTGAHPGNDSRFPTVHALLHDVRRVAFSGATL